VQSQFNDLFSKKGAEMNPALKSDSSTSSGDNVKPVAEQYTRMPVEDIQETTAQGATAAQSAELYPSTYTPTVSPTAPSQSPQTNDLTPPSQTLAPQMPDGIKQKPGKSIDGMPGF